MYPKIVFLLTLLLISFCTQDAKERNIALENPNQLREICDENAEDVFEALFLEKSKESMKVRSGQALSVVAAGGTAITETILYLGGGAAVGILVCSPILMAEAASDTKSGHGISCALEVGSKVSVALAAEGGYEYTKKVWKNTDHLRDFDYDELSSLVRANSECYLKTGQKKDIITAAKQIQEWKKNNDIWVHLSFQEQNKVEALEKRILSLLYEKNSQKN
ncbi:hypothetical protein LPTSP4_30030 [Leptospira ryugenii]|uniref:Uncharacterized protein n=1 Tax=Leptospira ryugenii TaxID=1917863 RepID=A0A2P2E3J5_9LEPT|nr:hypothetical protein [Leptospira ryugenii]GBF51465.1 hypothetical protein LPTSP4_30030 [Leptospira ryugenii]